MVHILVKYFFKIKTAIVHSKTLPDKIHIQVIPDIIPTIRK